MKKTELVNELIAVKNSMDLRLNQFSHTLEKIHKKFHKSAANLVSYMSMRTFDLQQLQNELSNLGLSSLTNPEAYAYDNVVKLLKWLNPEFSKDPKFDISPYVIDYYDSRDIIQRNTNRLFGKMRKGQDIHIMVTMPSEASFNYILVKKLIEAGMDIARINLSHDDIAIWQAIINNVKKGSEKTGKACKIYIDLAGPKIRTKHIHNRITGKLLSDKFPKLEMGEDFVLFDEDEVTLNELPNHMPVAVSVSIPSIVRDSQIGETIWIDDGKIGSNIIKKGKGYVVCNVKKCRHKGQRIRPEKGINLPDTNLNLPSLMPSDYENLDFVAANADIVGYSFVRRGEDVILLLDELNKRDANARIGMVLKIENQESFTNLPGMIIWAMQARATGVMIARGDLAVELGFEHVSDAQNTILSVCESGHIPVIWATQVLETLAKKGMATRSEVTDVAQATKSECIMLNKGPNILEAIQTVKEITSIESTKRSKKKNRLNKLPMAKILMQRIEKLAANVDKDQKAT